MSQLSSLRSCRSMSPQRAPRLRLRPPRSARRSHLLLSSEAQWRPHRCLLPHLTALRPLSLAPAQRQQGTPPQLQPHAPQQRPQPASSRLAQRQRMCAPTAATCCAPPAPRPSRLLRRCAHSQTDTCRVEHCLDTRISACVKVCPGVVSACVVGVASWIHHFHINNEKHPGQMFASALKGALLCAG